MLDLITLIPKCHEASRANGWWEPRPNPMQQLMLIVGELSELQEADRTGKKTKFEEYHKEASWANINRDVREEGWADARLKHLFEVCIKDTPGDELADAVIRTCDFIGGFGYDQEIILERVAHLRTTPEALTGELGERLLRLTYLIGAMAFAEKDGHDVPHEELFLANLLCLFEEQAVWMNIDLATHIDLKLAYNKLRGRKHGNKAY